MWVYIEASAGIFHVGFYQPDGRFEIDSEHKNRNTARQRVAWLNGGG